MIPHHNIKENIMKKITLLIILSLIITLQAKAGTLLFTNGYKYIGGLNNNNINGKGTLYREDGSIFYKGLWKNDKRNGKGIGYREDESIFYKGMWKNDKRDGKGTAYRADGSILYKGMWKNHKQNGKGTAYRADGSIFYKGMWKNSRQNGRGTVYRADGSILYKGMWKNNKYIGNKEKVKPITNLNNIFSEDKVISFLNKVMYLESKNNINSILNYFDREVSPYFNIRKASHNDIYKDKKSYFKKWHTRKYEVIKMKILNRYKEDEELYADVKYKVYWEASNDIVLKSGEAIMKITIRNINGNLKITSIRSISNKRYQTKNIDF